MLHVVVVGSWLCSPPRCGRRRRRVLCSPPPVGSVSMLARARGQWPHRHFRFCTCSEHQNNVNQTSALAAAASAGPGTATDLVSYRNSPSTGSCCSVATFACSPSPFARSRGENPVDQQLLQDFFACVTSGTAGARNPRPRRRNLNQQSKVSQAHMNGSQAQLVSAAWPRSQPHLLMTRWPGRATAPAPGNSKSHKHSSNIRHPQGHSFFTQLWR